MTRVLALDTTSRHASIAFGEDEKVAYEFHLPPGEELSACLIPSIDHVLKTVGIGLDAVDVFGIAVGPGLFTGLRVGLATLKGLLFQSQQRPVVPVVTLTAQAYQGQPSTAPVISLIDARREEIYFAGFHFHHSPDVAGDNLDSFPTPEEILAPRLIHFNELETNLDCNREYTFLGSGADLYSDFIRQKFPVAKVVPSSPILAPIIARIALAEYRRNNYCTDLQSILPLYIRKPDAELNARPPQKPSPKTQAPTHATEIEIKNTAL